MMDLDKIRCKIDIIDKEILSLFIERLNLIKQVSKVKSENNIEILDKNREENILSRVKENSGEYSKFTEDLFKQILRVSKEVQSKRKQK